MIRLLLFPLHWIFVKKAFSHKRRLRESFSSPKYHHQLSFLVLFPSSSCWLCLLLLHHHVGCVFFFFFFFSFFLHLRCLPSRKSRARLDFVANTKIQKYWYHFHKQNYRQIIFTFFGEEIVVFFHCSLIICID
jgi:hypothetical protein